MLRAIAKYLRQAGSTFSQAYMEDALAAHPTSRARLVELFQLRLDPERLRGHGREGAGARARARERDRRGREPRRGPDPARLPARRARGPAHELLPDGRRRPGEAVPVAEARPDLIPDLPEPRPLFEIFVYSPRVEGVHLRGGKVARGGIRWSDRREDFRTEVLGLMKAQMVKNAVIVPVGAKGGFVVKRPPAGRRPRRAARGGRRVLPDVHARAARRHRQHRRRRGRAAAATSCATTATTRTSSSPPTRARRRSPTSPTRSPRSTASGSATRSPPAARRATTTRRWASPRAARGSRCSATSASSASTSRRTDFTVVGIGDMSGDVFGNGMLLSRHIKLVAAFDHRHVFLDPDPDPAASFAERERLFELPRSSWADYDPALISAGGGVFPRTAKAIALSPEARAALGVEADVADAERADPRGAARAGRPALERRHRHVREGERRAARRGRRPGQRRRPRRRDRAALPRRRRGRQPRLHAARPGRVRARRRPDQHRRDRQLGRRRLLRPRGEHQDPARRDRRRRRPDRQAAQRAARGDDRRGRRARAARQLRAGAGVSSSSCAGGVDGRRARALHPEPRAGRAC